MQSDFATKRRLPVLRRFDAKIARGVQQMQRAKHADRKQETRRKIMIGEAAMRAGASHLPLDEIEAVLAHYVETGGSKELQSFVEQYDEPAPTASDEGGSEAARRGGAEIEPMEMAESVLQ